MMATIDNLRTIHDHDIAWAATMPPADTILAGSHDRRRRLKATTALDRRAWTLPAVAFGAAMLAASPAFPTGQSGGLTSFGARACARM